MGKAARLAVYIVLGLFATCIGLARLGRSKHDESVAAAPPDEPKGSASSATEQKSAPIGKLDALPAKAGDLTLVKAGFPERDRDVFVRGVYAWSRPGRVGVVEDFKSAPDAVVLCDTSAGQEINGDPVCGSKSGRRVKVSGRKLCVVDEEKHAPRGLKPQGAYISWTDDGWCSIEFRHGLVSTPDDRTAALATVEPIAAWMDQFIPPNHGPSPDQLTLNRAQAREALRSGR